MANNLELLDFPVLHQIFVELVRSGNFQDLQNARLVTNAPKWQAELQKVWRREAVLVLREDPLFTPRSPGPGIELQLFNTELENPHSFYNLQEMPYERLKLQNVTVNLPYLDGKEGDNAPAIKFWEEVGPVVKHLTLTKVTFIVDFFRTGRGTWWWRKNQDWVQFLRDQLPNLETLIMDGLKFSKSMEFDTEFEEERFISLESLPSAASSLKLFAEAVTLPTVSVLCCKHGNLANLKLWNFPNLQEIRLEHTWHLDTLLKSEAGKPIVNIKRLFLQDVRFKYLSERHFPSLEYLHLEISEEPDITETVRFINGHSATLKKLEALYWLGSLATVNPITSTFPVLTELHLWGNVIKDLSFLRFTPNLQKLDVDVYGFDKQAEMRAELRKHQDDLSLQTSHELMESVRQSGVMVGVQLTKLEYCQIYFKLSAEDVRTLAEWIPNLKTFKAVLESQGFRDACGQWRNLEELSCLFGSSISDEDIIAKGRLTDLKNLKVFSYLAECGGSTLSDVCINDGFLKLTQLTKLHISVSPGPGFSETGEEMARERIHEVKILRCQGGIQNDENASDCCRNLKYKKYIFDYQPVTSSNLSFDDLYPWEVEDSDLEEDQDEDMDDDDSEEGAGNDSEEDSEDGSEEDSDEDDVNESESTDSSVEEKEGKKSSKSSCFQCVIC